MCEWGTHILVENLLTADNFYRDWKIDACIAPIVDALNRGGVETLQSCCGHGKGPGRIDLWDGRVLVIDPEGIEHLPRFAGVESMTERDESIDFDRFPSA